MFERVAGAEQDADAAWLTLLPGFPDGSYGWAQVDRMLGDDLGPRLYAEPVGQGDSSPPRSVTSHPAKAWAPRPPPATDPPLTRH